MKRSNHPVKISRGGLCAWAAILALWACGRAAAEEKPNNTNSAAMSSTQVWGPTGGGRGFGVGAVLGEPSGLSLKCWVTEKTAIDAAVAWSVRRDNSFDVHADYLFHNFDWLPVAEGKLPVYFGVGGRVLFERHRDTRAGVRVPVGLAYMFPNAPVDIFLEVAPVVDLAPSTRGALEAGVGVRYFFR